MHKFVSFLKNLIVSFLRILFWKYKNYTQDLRIYNYKLSPRTKLGKRTMVRSDNEIGNITLGDYSYISGPRSYIEEVQIGKYCSIAREVVIGVSGHNYDWVTTSPIITSTDYNFIEKNRSVPQKEMPIIGNDVWIGLNSIIMRGVVIGDGAVVAAGSIVTADVKPYSIVGGIPAKHLKFRFSEEQISKLVEIQWWNWDEEKIKENVDLFYDIDRFILKHSN